jgi:hypothetical protein
MNTRSLRNEIGRLRESLPEQSVDDLPIVSIHPDQWPPAAAAAYWAADAADDDEEQRRLIRENTGQEVSRRPHGINLIVIRVVPRGEAEVVE